MRDVRFAISSTSLILSLLATYLQVNKSNREDNEEQNDRSCAGTSLVSSNVLVNVTNHSIESVWLSYGTESVTKYTYDTGIFLETTDKAGDNNVRNHGRKKRNGDSGEGSDFGSTVNLRRVVLLLVNALKTAEKNKDLEGQSIPYDVDNHYYDVIHIG